MQFGNFHIILMAQFIGEVSVLYLVQLNLLGTWNSDMIFFFCSCSITKQTYVLIISDLHCIQTINFIKF